MSRRTKAWYSQRRGGGAPHSSRAPPCPRWRRSTSACAAPCQGCFQTAACCLITRGEPCSNPSTADQPDRIFFISLCLRQNRSWGKGATNCSKYAHISCSDQDLYCPSWENKTRFKKKLDILGLLLTCVYDHGSGMFPVLETAADMYLPAWIGRRPRCLDTQNAAPPLNFLLLFVP